MTLAEQITDLRTPHGHNKPKRWTFTLEAGRGETYHHGRPTLYAHSTYERGSVLAGRPQRVFIAQWDNMEEARTAIAEAKKIIKNFKVDECGSTHIPTSVITSHLPDDTDY